MQRRKTIAGNWKMYTLSGSARELAAKVVAEVGAQPAADVRMHRA